MTKTIVLHPGDLFFGGTDHQVRTLLGFCMAMTLWHPQRHIGAMCHYVLPTRPSSQPRADAGEFDGRYGDEAWMALQHCVARSGTQLQDYHVGLFGGSRVDEVAARCIEDGQNNQNQALRLLQDAGLQARHVDCGGNDYRTIQFNLDSGEILVRHEQNPPRGYEKPSLHASGKGVQRP